MLLPSLPCTWRHYDVIISDMTSLLLRHAVWFLYESYSLNIFISILLDAVNGTPTHLIGQPIKIEPTSPAVFLQAISTWYYPAFLTTWPVLKTAESSVTPLWRHRPLTHPKNRIISNCKAHNQLQLKKLNNKILQNSKFIQKFYSGDHSKLKTDDASYSDVGDLKLVTIFGCWWWISMLVKSFECWRPTIM